MNRPLRGEGGQVTVMALGLALVAFAVAGVAVDGTRAFIARRTLQTSADASALAAASELDRAALYSSEGRAIHLAPAAARRVALEWLKRRGLPSEASIAAGRDVVTVTLRYRLPTTILGVVGVSSIPVAVRSQARPVASTRAP